MESDAPKLEAYERLAQLEQFRALVDVAPDLLFVITLPSGVVRDVNQTACDRLGATRVQVLNSPISHWIGQGREHFDRLLKQASPGSDATNTMVVDLIGRDQDSLPAEIVLRTLSLGTDHLAVITARDVADRYLARQALLEGDARLRGILQTLPTGVGIVTNRVFKQVNERLCEMTGYSSEEFLGKKTRFLYATDEEFESVGREILHQLREFGTGTIELNWVRKDGNPITLLGSVAPIDLDDLESSITFSVVDITERKRTEEAAEERILALTHPPAADSSVRFEELFDLNDIQKFQNLFADATGVASIITRPDGTPITAPSNFCRLCSVLIRKTPEGCRNCYRSDAVIGRENPDGPIVQPCLSGGLWDAGASVTVGGRHIANWLIGQVRNESQDEETALEYAREIGIDEEVYREAFREVPIMSREQFERVAQTLFVIANQLSTLAYQNVQQARFISERKTAETEREALIAELETKNAELERFSYTVSHDLKAPLITIKGYIGILAEDLQEGNKEDTLDDLGRIARAADTMGLLLQDLLELSRIGRIVNPPTEVAVDRLARQAVEAIAGPIAERGLRVEIEPGLPVALVDEQRLAEVIQNLVENAIKYAGDRPDPVVRIRAEESGNMVLVSVEDNGLGISPKYHERIFGLFDQLDSKSDGTGIGLAIVKRIIEVHGGRIWVESEGDETGAKFCFTIPAACPTPP